MGNRVLFQVVSPDRRKFSPVIYGHWSGGEAPDVIERLTERMIGRSDDISYVAARLVQELIGDDEGNLSFGLSNADSVLRKVHSQGDAGIYLIIADPDGLEFEHID